MKCQLITCFLLFVALLPAQVNNDRHTILPNASGLFTAVVTQVDSFKNWAAIHQIPIVATYGPANIVVLRASEVNLIKKIANCPEILSLSTTSAAPKEELPVPGHNIFVNKINVAQVSYPQWNGAGSVVSVKEFRFDSLDVDLQGRVLASPAAANQLTTHAAIMASLVAGAGISDLAGQGAAPGCQLRSSGFGLLLPDEDYAALGVSVQNHSYGIEIENFYGPNALAYDVSVQEHPYLLHVFSAGNSGAMTSNVGAYANVPAFANMTGNFKMAKNTICVGAVDSTANLALFSSRGPAYDGRIKPDLVAFGQDGSSGAAALVSGTAAVLQQTFTAIYQEKPPAALLRSILINSAVDLGRPGPDFEYGFGNLDANNALKTLLDGRVVSDSLQQGEIFSFPLTVAPGAQQLKITLAWDDLPAQVNAPRALVNDLNLTLKSPSGQSWSPWILNTFSSADSLRMPADRGRDTLNTVEQITLDNPEPGAYLLQVEGMHVVATQAFSLAYGVDTLNHFQWIFPFGNDPVVAAQELLLQWESNFSNTNVKLAWKKVGAQDWTLLDANVDLSTGFKRWLLPELFAEAQVRMEIGNQIFESDTFLIAKALQVRVGFNCSDSVALFWNKADDSADYLLYGLGNFEMEPLLIVPDTFVVLQKSLYPQQRFAVAPKVAGQNTSGRRSPSPDIATQGVACYQKSFLVELSPDNEVLLLLSLGTVHGLTKLQFERLEPTGFVPIKLFEPVGSELFIHTDVFPRQGRNTYRALLFSSNGGHISTDTLSVYLPGEDGWLLFPNPAQAGASLKVLAAFDDHFEFRIFDTMGRLVQSQSVMESLAEIKLAELPAGLYFFEARESREKLWSGKLVLRH